MDVQKVVNHSNEMESYSVQVFVGLKERDTGVIHDIQEVYELIQDHCDIVGLCVTVTGARYIYTNGWEDGVIIGLIQYPRFPDKKDGIWYEARSIAEKLMYAFNQYRVTMMDGSKVLMLSNENLLD